MKLPSLLEIGLLGFDGLTAHDCFGHYMDGPLLGGDRDVWKMGEGLVGRFQSVGCLAGTDLVDDPRLLSVYIIVGGMRWRVVWGSGIPLGGITWKGGHVLFGEASIMIISPPTYDNVKKYAGRRWKAMPVAYGAYIALHIG